MKENKILASLILKDGSDKRVVNEAKALEEQGAEGICVYEKSTKDYFHEENIHIIKAICEAVTIPVYSGGNVNNLEDVKKFLYAGCEGIITNVGDNDLIKEACKRFGNFEEPKGFTDEKISFGDLTLNKDGLIPCIVQDHEDGTVLMMAYMNEESFNLTISTGKMTYYSRSRNKLWVKGEESGHTQYLKSLTTDCDKDTLLAIVKQIGPACHTGARSCFFNDIVGSVSTGNASQDVLKNVYDIIMDRRDNPKEGSYTNYLFDKGIDKVLKKVGEESTEIIIAAKNPEPEEIIYEISDFLYHVSVLMAMKNVTWDQIMTELKNR